MLSIFDLESMSLEELSEILPYNGEGENLYRCQVALLLENQQMLEQSLLQVNEMRDIFIGYLSMTDDDLSYQVDNGSRLIKHRLILCYVATIHRFSRNFNMHFEYEYDQAYLNYVSNIGDIELDKLITSLRLQPETTTAFVKEKSKRYFLDLVNEFNENEEIDRIDEYIPESPIRTTYLCKLAYDYNNMELYQELLRFNNDWTISVLAPTTESVQKTLDSVYGDYKNYFL